MNKTHWKNLANYDYLGAYSLQGADSVILTIDSLKKERVTANGGNSEECIVAYFKETDVNGIIVKPMVFNKTNCKAVESLYGSYIEDWVGKQIIVFATETKFQREMVPCLRIKREIPPAPQVHHCQVCGKELSDNFYTASITKYGVAVCSKECLDKTNKQEENN